MTKTAANSTSSNVGVRIDHRKAQIVVLTAEGESTRVILSNVEKHPERGGDSPMRGAYEARQAPADDRRQRVCLDLDPAAEVEDAVTLQLDARSAQAAVQLTAPTGGLISAQFALA